MFSERRSVRRFKTDAIDNDALHNVLEAARWAPSWANTQCAELVLVKDGATKKQLAEVLSKKNPATLAVENAPLVIAVCGKLGVSGYYSGKALTKFADWLLYDLGLVTENICIAAHQQGLGTVIVGAFDHDKTREILGVPSTHEVVALLPIGYPDHEPPAPKRKSMEEFVHWNSFGNN